MMLAKPLFKQPSLCYYFYKEEQKPHYHILIPLKNSFLSAMITSKVDRIIARIERYGNKSAVMSLKVAKRHKGFEVLKLDSIISPFSYQEFSFKTMEQLLKSKKNIKSMDLDENILRVLIEDMCLSEHIKDRAKDELKELYQLL